MTMARNAGFMVWARMAASLLAAGDGGKQQDRRACGHLGVEAAEQTHVVAVDEDVEEARHAVSLEHPWAQRRVGRHKLVEGLADGAGLDRDRPVSGRLRPQHGWDANLGHVASKDKAPGDVGTRSP